MEEYTTISKTADEIIFEDVDMILAIINPILGLRMNALLYRAKLSPENDAYDDLTKMIEFCDNNIKKTLGLI